MQQQNINTEVPMMALPTKAFIHLNFLELAKLSSVYYTE